MYFELNETTIRSLEPEKASNNTNRIYEEISNNKLEPLPRKTQLPQADWTRQYILILIPVFVLALVVTAMVISLLCSSPNYNSSLEKAQKEALMNSLVLVGFRSERFH